MEWKRGIVGYGGGGGYKSLQRIFNFIFVDFVGNRTKMPLLFTETALTPVRVDTWPPGHVFIKS